MTQRVMNRLARVSPTAVFLCVGALVFVALVLPGPVGAPDFCSPSPPAPRGCSPRPGGHTSRGHG